MATAVQEDEVEVEEGAAELTVVLADAMETRDEDGLELVDPELADASLRFSRVLDTKGASQATLQVAVRCRPVSKAERREGQFSITRLVDDKVVVVMNPDEVGRHRLCAKLNLVGGIGREGIPWRRWMEPTSQPAVAATAEREHAGSDAALTPHAQRSLQGECRAGGHVSTRPAGLPPPVGRHQHRLL